MAVRYTSYGSKVIINDMTKISSPQPMKYSFQFKEEASEHDPQKSVKEILKSCNEGEVMCVCDKIIGMGKASIARSNKLKVANAEFADQTVVECKQCEESDNSALSGLQAIGKEQHNDKMDKILSKLEKLTFIALEIQTLRDTVHKINLIDACVEKDLKSETTETQKIKDSVSRLNKDVEHEKANLEKSNKKLA
ncbi:hypothetical protein ACROYT_G015040 [Oculina patagonica]